MLEKSAFRLAPDVARKAHALAVKRRDYLADLYHSGRWSRFFSEQSFLALMRETVRSVEIWASLAYPKDSVANDQAPAADRADDPARKAERAA